MSKEENKGGLELLLAVITIVSAVIFIAKMFSKGQEGEEHDNTEASAAKARKDLYKQIPPSFSPDVYRDWADALDIYLLQQFGENEDGVYNIFNSVRNVSDVAKIIEAFGHRRDFFSYKYISLPQAIANKFSENEIFKLNKILLGKRIPYQFK